MLTSFNTIAPAVPPEDTVGAIGLISSITYYTTLFVRD